MFLSFEKRLRRGTGVCTCNYKESAVHQNCDLSNGTTIETISNDRMYGSTGALYQRPDQTNINLSVNVRDKLKSQTFKSASNIPRLLTPLRLDSNKSFGSQTSNTCAETSLAQTSSCRSTPSLSLGILRRQKSLGQLEGNTGMSRSQNCRNSEGPFGAFQQRIRSMLLPSKDSTKSKNNPNVPIASSSENQASAADTCPQPIVDIQRNDNFQEVANNSFESSISQIIEMDNSVEVEDDSFHIRDVCSKWFGQKQSPLNHSFSSQMVSAVNKTSFLSDSPKLSHNMKSTLLEKVITKDSICQNAYINNTYNENCLTNGWTHQPIDSVNRPQNSTDCHSNYMPTEGHVVVVSGLDCDKNRKTCLTVRSEVWNDSNLGANGMTHTNSSPLPTSAYLSLTTNTGHKTSEIEERVESVSSPDHNYKSSSDSGRGTIRSRNLENGIKNNGSNQISPLDLTSLDSDQSLNGIPTDVCTEQNKSNESDIKIVSNSETIEKMQRELQRILEDNHSVQSIEVEVEDLSRNFQTRLSVVNESDSWTSNSAAQTPQPQQKATSVKCCEPNVDQKYSTNGLNGTTNTTKAFISKNSKQKCISSEKPNDSYNKPKIICEKTKYQTQRNAKTSQVSNTCPKRRSNERSLFASNKVKQRSHLKSKERFIESVDCDILSTTTARDSNYDDLSSEYTANTSLCGRNNDDSYALRKQLQGLETMYSEIIGMLGSRKRCGNHSSRRKVCRSTSSIVSGRSSVTSRGTRDLYYRRRKPDFRQKYDESDSCRRIKRLESHVITLARSVAQLSTDMRYNQSLSQEIDNLRQDVDLTRSQLMAFKQTLSSNLTPTLKASHHTNGHISTNSKRNQNHIMSANKVEKLKRFFGDEPPLLRQFLKKLGYEKYARNFESEKIGITELPYLTDERMQKLGIPLGPRMRIMQESHSHIKSISHSNISNADNYSIYAIV